MKTTTLTALFFWTAGVLAASRTSAPSGCLTVGSGATYTTIQAAVNALSTTATGTQCIFIKSGTYNEQVLVSARSASKFSIYGYTLDDTSFSGNTVTIVSSKSQNDGIGNDETGTLRVKANNFRLYNVNVQNAYGAGSQAVALSAYSDAGYYGSKFIGYQDTLLSNTGKQIYVDTQITGATDFIFGQTAQSWFERADIRVVAKSIGYVTAHGRSSATSSWYVFDHSTISAKDGDSVPDGAYYLGRPWGAYARVTFQRTAMSAAINSAGWRIWNTGDERISNVEFGEYQNTGTGSQGTRASFSKTLSSPVAITTILGSDYTSKAWYDATYFAGNGADVGSS